MSPLSDSEQRFLLRLARQALEWSVCQGREWMPQGSPERLREPGAAFVTLRKLGALRGCIGRVDASGPLDQTVCDCARAAALEDPRFDPVVSRELPDLHIDISVLSPLAEIAPGQIEVGRHGLYISWGSRRGLLLPQVATEWNWDRYRFLQETCRKAGLPPDAWQHGARVQGFTVQVFAEPEMPQKVAAVEGPHPRH